MIGRCTVNISPELIHAKALSIFVMIRNRDFEKI